MEEERKEPRLELIYLEWTRRRRDKEPWKEAIGRNRKKERIGGLRRKERKEPRLELIYLEWRKCVMEIEPWKKGIGRRKE